MSTLGRIPLVIAPLFRVMKGGGEKVK